ncbi:NAD(P)H-binding protein [Chondromyces crocatus]|uniref:Hydroxylase n=1 Tax=Chondromyces crocatus TaxID=52 RepID=A0A0K1EH07_CHOCO|nr:NAD(P)H-binding protein [Chondromyces crocatus]AKT40129.1 hydroxylase [Chondromyces crocatus]
MTILVTGATGSVGRHVVEQLLERGQQVRALTRHPGKASWSGSVEIVQGDLAQPASLPAALKGVERVYLFPVPESAEAFVALAREVGVQRVVVLSSSSAVNRGETNAFLSDHHLAVERAVEASGLAWTHLRPGGFAGNTLEWAPSIQAESVVRAPYGKAAQSPIHEADIAEVAVKALLEDGHEGAKYLMSGPEAIARVDQVRAIGKAIGREVRFEEISPDAWRASVRQFLPESIIEMLLGYWAAAVAQPDPVWPAVEDVLGRPARTFQQWAIDHAREFS